MDLLRVARCLIDAADAAPRVNRAVGESRAAPDIGQLPRVQAALHQEQRRLHPLRRQTRVHALPAVLAQAVRLDLGTVRIRARGRVGVGVGVRVRVRGRIRARVGVGIRVRVRAAAMATARVRARARVKVRVDLRVYVAAAAHLVEHMRMAHDFEPRALGRVIAGGCVGAEPSGEAEDLKPRH
eukprot:scaffold10127_cov64-Phaeocystis_antarctica.AAC.5